MIASTVNGVVLDVPVEVGYQVIQANTFNEGTSIASVADMTDLIFRGQIDESEIENLRVGIPLILSIGAMLAALGASYRVLKTKIQRSEEQNNLEMGMLSAAAAGGAMVTVPTRVLQRSPVPTLSAADATRFIKDTCKGDSGGPLFSMENGR